MTRLTTVNAYFFSNKGGFIRAWQVLREQLDSEKTLLVGTPTSKVFNLSLSSSEEEVGEVANHFQDNPGRAEVAIITLPYVGQVDGPAASLIRRWCQQPSS